jgi:hypothetical protein
MRPARGSHANHAHTGPATDRVRAMNTVRVVVSAAVAESTALCVRRAEASGVADIFPAARVAEAVGAAARWARAVAAPSGPARESGQ